MISSPIVAQDYEKGYSSYKKVDYATAMKEWRPLAEAGDAEVQRDIGVMYNVGQGVTQDYKEAVKWFKLAARRESNFAQFSLGHRYANGEGVIQNNIMAHMWFNIASARGMKDSSHDRDQIAKKMTQDDIYKAQDLARKCMESDYQDCLH